MKRQEAGDKNYRDKFARKKHKLKVEIQMEDPGEFSVSSNLRETRPDKPGGIHPQF